MRRVRFFVDGRGPFEGMMKFGTVGDGEIERARDALRAFYAQEAARLAAELEAIMERIRRLDSGEDV